MVAAIRAGKTHYTPAAGTMEVRCFTAVLLR
jgi:hypothetical protein